MELKPGYKQTEVGVIPADWNIYLIQKLIDEKAILDHMDGNHGELYPRSHEFKPQGVPYIAANTLEDGQVNFSACKFLSKERAAKFQKGIAKNGDVLFAHNATVGPTAILRTKLNYIILSTTVTYYRCNPDKIYNAFLFYILQAPFFIKQYQAVMSQSTRNQVPITAQRKFSVALPPTLKEQTAIANALSDADALIQFLTSLIAKKRQIKQGAMQTLLNPYENGRLKEGWVVKKLGEITDLLTGFPFSSLGYTNEGIRLLRGSNIKRGQTDWNDEITKYWPSMTSDIRRYELLEGDIVVAMDGSLVGRSFAQLKQSDLPALLLQRVARIRSKSESFDINYIKEWVCSEIFTKHCDSLKTVTAIPHISPADIYNFVLNVPEQKEEQTRIATILSGMDAEIAALETKLAKYRHIKQGMMQNLLTGRTRLVQPGSNTGAVA